ncbi:bifunctional non-homologous end joining protein LigD [Paenibacillus shirakamiensis]|uniref:Bifunctional non-homologous end joining protein LigD n=1 Tax=Paenibacillus shirakamiensis TaxID=1265935 RepID=A0ABS4JF22_9BACL|nr:non-homologous end-joining DNA ligase [Paenibacillus shirakamiensis]MBP2000316.1 bifunctional non-homologous end joining protein LigD [Paenibacillus shirakamiensis]
MSSSSFEVEVEGHLLILTNPDKLLWPEMGITKALYLQKLVALAPYLLPYCRNRYLTTIRYPDGTGGKSFYQKNAPQPLPEFVKTARQDQVNYIHLDNLATLIWLGNLGCLEFHPSFEYIGTNEPAEWVLDIDPSSDQDVRLMGAISVIGEALHSLGIQSVPKTSGATGVQIIIPIQSGTTFEQLHKVGTFLSQFLTEKYPELFTTQRLIKDRGNRIYIDYVQHAKGKSLSAPYTPRGRPLATVSTPLLWEEVQQEVKPQDFHLLNMEERLAIHGDLIAKTPKQSLTPLLDFIP